MNTPPSTPLNTCPVCAAHVGDQKLVGGLWTGSVRSRASSGPLHAATCQACGSELLAFPTREEAAAGEFLWVLERDM